MLHLWRGGWFHGLSPKSPLFLKPCLDLQVSAHLWPFQTCLLPTWVISIFPILFHRLSYVPFSIPNIHLLNILDLPYLCFNPWPSIVALVVYSCWHSGNPSAWSLRITTVSGMFPVVYFPCICYRCKVHNSHCCICSSGIFPYYSIYNRSPVGFCGCFTSYIVLANDYVKHLCFCYLPTPVITGIDHIPMLLLIIWVLYSSTCQQPGESQSLL